MTDRTALANRFLESSGWGNSNRVFLAGDASERSYERVWLDGKSAVLMDAPPGKGDDSATFLRIAAHLRGIGLSAPECLAEDLADGFLLIEDLGDGLFARLVSGDPKMEMPLYAAAVDTLLHLQRHAAPSGLPNLSASDWADAAAFVLDWYRFAITGERVDGTQFRAVLTQLLSAHADGPRTIVLRDYHAENLLWLPSRKGIARVGLLDFQLAQLGQPAYDLVSLLQDARRDVSLEAEAAMIVRFQEAAGVNAQEFSSSYAVLGAQRALRILGIFARLCLVGGKPGYVGLMPRVWRQLQINLQNPVLAPLERLCADLLPQPSAANLALIGDKCARFR